MSYVRIDTETQYIYFENDTIVGFATYYDSAGIKREYIEERSQYTLKTCYECIRMTRKNNIPSDKKVNVWYTKIGKEEKNDY